MDFKDLLQIAEGNTSLSKKKVARFGAEKYDSKRVSSSAVAKFIAKKKAETDNMKAKEIEARKKRILARLQSTEPAKKQKLTVEEQKITNKKNSDQKTELRAAENVKKKANSASLNHSTENIIKEKTLLKQVNSSSNFKNFKSCEPEHRKSVQSIESKPKAKKIPNNSMSFAQLAALAKNNSTTAKVENLSVLKTSNNPPKKAEVLDPDKNVKVKNVNNKEQKLIQVAGGSDKKSSKLLTKTQKNNNNTLTNNVSKNHIKQNLSQKQVVPNASSAVKRGLIAETICEGNILKKGLPLKSLPSTAGVKKAIVSPQKKNIKVISKKSAADVESEFEKEERMLARKRKLFEMRRVTGNNHLAETDLYDEVYDLDEDDSEDDDFIDNSGETSDVSHYIKKIFGYDRTRYSDTDEEDLKNMDSSYSQIEKEEARSARIARIEDEYEAMKEQEELEKKLMKAKKSKMKKIK